LDINKPLICPYSSKLKPHGNVDTELRREF